jgi:hypothetical protein
MYTCPACEQVIDKPSGLCPGCGADLTAAAGDEITKLDKKSRFLTATVLWSAIITILWAIAWFALPWHLSGARPAAELRARETLATLQEALESYQVSNGSYPRSLEVLGDRARQAAQSAESVHYTLQYTFGNSDVDGRIKNYSLVARARDLHFLNFYTDQTGVFRATLEDRAATAQDPPLKPNS